MALNNPNYESLAAQVARRVVAEIRQGRWRDRLPSERALATTLMVSRKTIRKAIDELRRASLIETSGKAGHYMGTKRISPARQTRSIGLLAPEPLERLAAHTALWIDELRASLFEHRIRLAVFSGQRYYQRKPERELADLLRQFPQTCWVFARTTERIQRWLAEQAVPCVIAGSCYAGIRLPNVDHDYFAVCRHAVGAMVRLGHRRVALLIAQPADRGNAGSIESETGFLDGLRASGLPDTKEAIVRHDGTVPGALRALTRLFRVEKPPTALLIAEPEFYLTAVAFMAERNLRVGNQVSLVCRDYDRFITFLTPSPAYYTFDSTVYARHLCALVMDRMRRETSRNVARRIEPKFVSGSSLRPAPKPVW